MSTILHRLAAWAEENPTAVAQNYKQSRTWKAITAKEYCDRVFWLALFLESRGMTSKDIGTILSYNCPEWVHMDLAAPLLGAKSAGIYPNSTTKDILYVLNHTESRFFAVQNKEYFQKAGGVGAYSSLPPRIELVLVFDGDTSFSQKAVSYKDAIEQGKKIAATRKLSDYLNRLDPNAGAFMIYTSGTTGNPKGALISHDNLAFTVERIIEHWNLVKKRGHLFSFLPLCHIAEKLQNIGAGITNQYAVSFCSKFEKLAEELPEVQPSLLLCVPRVWEKMMEGVMKKVTGGNPVSKSLALWALRVGERTSNARLKGGHVPFVEKIDFFLADRLVLSRIRHALGLAHIEASASGAAVLPIHVYKWFRTIGIEIVECFGQTESSGVICMTKRGVDSAGSVGNVVKGVEMKLLEDGEILTKGRTVFVGYYKDDAATAQALQDGWLHTGDLGELDKSGMVRIRGRKKEILKTSGGKMVAPLPIEEALKASPLISQVCVVGDGRKFCSALMTLTEATLDQIHKKYGEIKERTITTPDIVAQVQSYVDQLNSTLASYEQVKKFAILSKEFSIAEGEMTPTLKMKRNVVEKKYEDIINHFYI